MIKYTAIRDERGTTYVAPLPHPVLTGYYETAPATHVMVWYNRDTRDWVVSYSSTAFGQQVGSSEYVGSRSWADDEAQDLVNAAAACKPNTHLPY